MIGVILICPEVFNIFTGRLKVIARVYAEHQDFNRSSLNSFESIAIGFVEGCFHGFDPNRFPEIYDSITTEDILRFLADNLTREKLAMSIITAKEG